MSTLKSVVNTDDTEMRSSIKKLVVHEIRLLEIECAGSKYKKLQNLFELLRDMDILLMKILLLR